LEKASYWLLFGAALSVAPLAVEVWKIFGSTRAIGAAVDTVLKDGEMFLICVALLGASIGEMVQLEGSKKFARICIVGIGVLGIIFCTLAYSETLNGKVDVDLIVMTSKACFAMTAVIGMSTVLVNMGNIPNTTETPNG